MVSSVKCLVQRIFLRTGHSHHPHPHHTSSLQEISYFHFSVRVLGQLIYLTSSFEMKIVTVHLLEINPTVLVLVGKLLCLVLGREKNKDNSGDLCVIVTF